MLNINVRPSGGGDKPGTKSGFINSLNQPASGSPQAGIIKDCFTAPQGKILMASDLASLEDRVLANVANSKAKQDLILDGYDGHLYHACMYFRDQFLEILDLPSNTEHTTVVLAAMERKDEKEIKTLRSTSKGVTFGASYGAYPKKIAESIGCSIEQGEQIFDAYHNKLYPEITEYKETYVIPTVRKQGEIHMLLGASLKSDDVDKDVRTIYNATIQSFSVITLIAIAQMQKLIDKADLNNQVKIINTVYDAAYFEVDDDPIIIKWVNDNFIPLITQPYLLNEKIPNDANCDIGYNLNHMIELQKQASIEQIEDTLIQLKDPKE